ncbi:unnamed protein product [Orchesella dallaii]|uniref:Uncharacterized protein n=1 Tax=Orchesella dallaii TaxID=48710 RepID=A0ABP1S7B4_9HEXA
MVFQPISLFQDNLGNSTFGNFQRWTLCQTVSLVFNIVNKDGPVEADEDNLESTFLQLTSKVTNANPLTPVPKKLRNKSVKDVPLSGLPLLIFFVLSVTRHVPEHWLHPSLFSRLYSQKSHQIPYRVSYRLQPSQLAKWQEFPENPMELIFMCKFCNFQGISIDEFILRYPFFILAAYPFKDYLVSCPEGNLSCRSQMSKVYDKETADGGNITYCIMPFVRIGPTNKLAFIRRLKDPRKILRKKPKLDEILLAIFTEQIFSNGGALRYSRLCLYLPWIIVIDGVMQSDINLVPVHASSYNFLTCDGALTSINFLTYLQPFELPVWIILLLSIGLTVLAMLAIKPILAHVHPNYQQGELTANSIILTITALLLDSEVHVGLMCRNRNLRGFLAIWLYGALILNTAYRGDNFANFIAPIDKLKTWTKFTELQNFTLFTTGGMVKDSKTQSSMFQFSIIKWLKYTIDDEAYAKFYVLDSTHDIEYNESVLEQYKFFSSKEKKIAKMFSKIRPIATPTNLRIRKVVQLISGCNQTAFVADHSQIATIHKEIKESVSKWNLSLARDKIYMGKDKLFNDFRIWGSSKSGGNYLQRRMERFMGSGIYQFWGQFFEKGSTASNMKRNHGFTNNAPLSLGSNLVTMFYIFVFGCGISIIACGVEIFRKHGMKGWSGKISDDHNNMIINVIKVESYI